MAAAIAIQQNGELSNIFAGRQKIRKDFRVEPQTLEPVKPSTAVGENNDLDGTTVGGTTLKAVPVSEDDLDFIPTLNSDDSGETYIYGLDVMSSACKCCPPLAKGLRNSEVQVRTRGRRRGQYRLADGKPAKMGPWRPTALQV